MVGDVNIPGSSEEWFRLNDEDAIGQALSQVLQARLDSDEHAWAYHPQSSLLGKTVAELILARLLHAEPELQRLGRSRRLISRFDHKVTARRRERKVDLCLELTESDGRPLPRLVLEVKACMTEHQKARPRLRSELLQTLDIARALDPPALVVGVLVFNLSERFLSPLNLPGHNRHDHLKCLRTLEKLIGELGIEEHDGYDELLMVPIDFDNDVAARPILGKNRPRAMAQASRPLDRIARRLSQLSAVKSSAAPSDVDSNDSTSNA